MSDIDKNLDAKLAEIFGNRYTSAYDTQCKDVSSATNGQTAYKKIKNKINHLFRLTTKSDGRGIIADWLKENKPVSICVVSNDIANDFIHNLNYQEIPFTAIRKTRQSLFVFRDNDRNKATAVLQDTKNSIIFFSEIYNYPDFVTWCENNGLKPFFITGLNELEVESLKSLIKVNSIDNKFGVFRTNDYKCGMGFNAENLISGIAENDRGFLESYLTMTLLMSGKSGAYYTNGLDNDLRIDKLAALYFSPALKEHEQVYVFNPNYPRQALKITKDGYCRADICAQNSHIEIKESALQTFGSYMGALICRKELIRMEHKQMVFSEEELLNYANNWIKDASSIRRNEFIIDQKMQLAKELNSVFIGQYKNESWLSDPLKMEIQLTHFKETIVPILNNLKEGRLPEKLSAASKEKILSIMELTDLGTDTFNDAATQLEVLTIQKEVGTQEKIDAIPDFKAQLLNLSRQHRESGAR